MNMRALVLNVTRGRFSFLYRSITRPLSLYSILLPSLGLVRVHLEQRRLHRLALAKLGVPGLPEHRREQLPRRQDAGPAVAAVAAVSRTPLASAAGRITATAGGYGRSAACPRGHLPSQGLEGCHISPASAKLVH
eukprot:scaffold1406_cov115-Isochrysis_galbana.AAC.6